MMIKKVLKSKWSIVIMFICWLLLLWSRTFIGLANGCETSVFDILGKAVVALVTTFMWGCNLFLWDDEIGFFYKDSKSEESDFCDEDERTFGLEETTDGYGFGLGTSLCVVLVLAVFCMLSFVMSDWKEWIDLFSNNIYIRIGEWNINKKCVFDMRTSRIWIIELAVVNVVTLILAVRSYIWKAVQKKGNVLALLILYEVVWIVLLAMFYHKGQSIYDYMGFADLNSKNGYFFNIRKILENASFIGQSVVLLRNPYVLQFLEGSHYLLPSILFYLGWLPAILLIVVEVVFMISTAGVIIQNQQHDGRDIMLQTIWIGLFVRVLGGILYSFGVPIPILLPFTGTVGIIVDTVCSGILILSFVFNKLERYCELIEDKIIDEFLEEWDDDEEDDE